MMMHQRSLCLLLGLGFCLSCAGVHRAPDLEQLYSRAAQVDDFDRNPVVVIPGLIGSRLEAEDGTVVWGQLGGAFANPKTAAGARRIALPMAISSSLEELRDEVRATDVLGRLHVKVLGVPIEISAYVKILDSLGVGGYRDETTKHHGSVDYGTDHYSCFQYPYDWRRDIVEAARNLHGFLLEKRGAVQRQLSIRYGVANPEVRFDVVAHSMGGLVARYYLRYGTADLPEDGSLPELTWAGAEMIQRVVLVAPPNAGVLRSILDLVEGRKFGPILPRYQPAVLGTFPGGYQLLPRSRHMPLVLKSSGKPLDLDLFDVEVWKKLQWGLADPRQDAVLQQLLPDVKSARERRAIALDHLAKCLERARRLMAALDVPAEPPPGTELHLIAGDSRPTDQTLTVDPTTGKIHVASRGPGDGVVLRSSALMDERKPGAWTRRLISPVHWSSATFLSASHLGLTKDPAFTNNVLYLLLENPN